MSVVRTVRFLQNNISSSFLTSPLRYTARRVCAVIYIIMVKRGRRDAVTLCGLLPCFPVVVRVRRRPGAYLSNREHTVLQLPLFSATVFYMFPGVFVICRRLFAVVEIRRSVRLTQNSAHTPTTKSSPHSRAVSPLQEDPHVDTVSESQHTTWLPFNVIYLSNLDRRTQTESPR